MAIQLDVEQTQFGVGFQGAYFRVALAAVSKDRNEAGQIYFRTMIDVAGYATPPTETNIPTEIDFRRYVVPYSEIESQEGDTFLSKVYSWVMQQPDMAGSVAV